MTSLTDAFLNVHWDRAKPLLLGYSGGPDSKALLYALLECGVRPHLAHVDHGWRPESGTEAEQLRAEASALGCPFHITRLELKDKTEDAAREARLLFFRSLIAPYQALLLAHQADDLAETVLKRVLEGAHLPFLSGMQPVSQHHGMTLWRPLLFVRRSAILQFLEERALTPLFDPTNENPLYLRSRMRREILPDLSRQFGKEVVDNLTLLSERTAELKHYLDRRVAHAKIHRGAWGVLVELEGFERMEQRHILQKVAREQSVTLSRQTLETILNWVEEAHPSKQLEMKNQKISVDQGKVWFFSLPSKGSSSGVYS